MKNVTKLFSSILLLLSFSAHAQKEGIFFGSAVGAGNYGGISEFGIYSASFVSPEESISVTTSTEAKTKTEFGWKTYIGYNFNEYLGIEAGYADYGKLISVPVVASVSISTPTERSLTETVATAEIERKGVVLYGVVTYPITPRLDVFGKAGVFAPDTKVKLRTGVYQLGLNAAQVEEFNGLLRETEASLKNTLEGDKASAAFGLGLKYTFSNNFGLRAEWEGHTTDLVSGRESFYFFNLGIFYQF